MKKRRSSAAVSRRFWVVSVLFALFVLFDIGLFSWLIFRSLSQRELDRVLLETQTDARNLADLIAEKGEIRDADLYLVMTFDREVGETIDNQLGQQEFVTSIAVFDENDTLVYQSDLEDAELAGGIPLPSRGDSLEVLPREGTPTGTGDQLVGGTQVREAIAGLGWVQYTISPAQLRQRIAVLRKDLVEQTLLIGMVSLLVLVTAYVIIWMLLRRARRAEEQAADAERLAYVGTLAAGLAHEIRNPLNSLNLNMQMLAEDLGGGPASNTAINQRLLGITRQEISRLEGLVTDFLSYARPRPLEVEEVAPADLLQHARSVLAAEAEARGAEMVIEDRSEGARLRVDRGQINQLLLNLIQNALAATEESGRPPRVVLGAEVRGARIALTVGDNGVGIPAEEQARIFDVFYSTRKGGTGLGLAVVDRIAKAHSGEIELGSVPGEGTTVAVVLPGVGLPQRSLTGQFQLVARESRG